MEGLERMDLKQIQQAVPVLMKLLLNVTMRQRQQESISLVTLLMDESAQPVVHARARVRGWVEHAQDLRARGKDSEVAATGTI
eukprot:2217273-Pyramimonas_sp.AAC.1